MVLKGLPSSVSECILLWSFINWFLFWVVLWAWILLKSIALESGLGTNLWSKTSGLSRDIGFDGVVQEESILVEIIFGLVLAYTDFSSH